MERLENLVEKIMSISQPLLDSVSLLLFIMTFGLIGSD